MGISEIISAVFAIVVGVLAVRKALKDKDTIGALKTGLATTSRTLNTLVGMIEALPESTPEEKSRKQFIKNSAQALAKLTHVEDAQLAALADFIRDAFRVSGVSKLVDETAIVKAQLPDGTKKEQEQLRIQINTERMMRAAVAVDEYSKRQAAKMESASKPASILALPAFLAAWIGIVLVSVMCFVGCAANAPATLTHETLWPREHGTMIVVEWPVGVLESQVETFTTGGRVQSVAPAPKIIWE